MTPLLLTTAQLAALIKLAPLVDQGDGLLLDQGHAGLAVEPATALHRLRGAVSSDEPVVILDRGGKMVARVPSES